MRRFSPKILLNNRKLTLILKNTVFKFSFPADPLGNWASERLPYLWRLTSLMRHSSDRTNERTTTSIAPLQQRLTSPVCVSVTKSSLFSLYSSLYHYEIGIYYSFMKKECKWFFFLEFFTVSSGENHCLI